MVLLKKHGILLSMMIRPEPYPKTLYSSSEAAQKLKRSRQYLSILKRHPRHKLRFFDTKGGHMYLVREIDQLARLLNPEPKQNSDH